MAAVEKAVSTPAETKASQAKEAKQKYSEAPASKNSEEIDLDEDEDVEASGLAQMPVPDAVFGTAESAQSSLGALERMRQAAAANKT